MYEFIDGNLVSRNPTQAVLECNGIGYVLSISLHTYSKLPEHGRCRLFTHLTIREDAHSLFGFADEAERQVFRLLISVSGVGASTARMILSSLSPADIQQTIMSGDAAGLQRIKGIGAKSAQRIIIDLRDKIGGTLQEGLPVLEQGNTAKEQALSALVTLGFVRNTADKVLTQVLRQSPALGVGDLIKQALKTL